MKIIKKIFVLFLLFSLNALLFASGKNLGNNLTEYKLENGLTVFVAENHSVPLAYIEIAVKAGAVTQTKETAGLFHLYEHMMFKGNSRFPDSASGTFRSLRGNRPPDSGHGGSVPCCSTIHKVRHSLLL